MEHDERFNRLYAETRNAMLRFLMLRTNADPETEDLFQEIYRQFYLRLTRGLPIRDDSRYLFAIAKKTLARYYRKKAKRIKTEQPFPEDEDLVADDEPLDEHLRKAERRAAVWQLLNDEPELSRRAFVLYYGCDRSQKEIGEALGISERAVRQRLYRTRSRIRTMLEAQERSEE